MANIWDKPARFTMTAPPYEAIAAGLLTRKKAYEEGQKAVGDINDNFLKLGSIKADTPDKLKRIGELQSEVASIAQQYGNDLALALPAIKGLQQKINYETTYGALGAYDKRYKQAVARNEQWDEFAKSYIEKGEGVNLEDITAARDYEMNILNSKPTTQDQNGVWNSTYYTAGEQREIKYLKEFVEIADKIEPQTIQRITGLVPTTGGYYMDLTTKEKKRPQEAIEMTLRSIAASDPRYKGYLDWHNKIHRKDVAAVTLADNAEMQAGKSMDPNGVTVDYIDGDLVPGYEGYSYEPGFFKDMYKNDLLYAPMEGAIKQASFMKQINDYEESASYHKNWMLEKSMDEAAKAKEITDVFDTPITEDPFNFQEKIDVANDAIYDALNDVTGEIEEDQPGFFENAWNLVSNSVQGAMSLIGWLGVETVSAFTPDSSEFQQTLDAYDEALTQKMIKHGKAEWESLPFVQTLNSREKATVQSDQWKKDFPSLRSIPQELENRTQSGVLDDRTYTWDKNSSLVHQITLGAYGNMTALSNKVVVNNTTNSALQKALVETGIISQDGFGTLVNMSNPKEVIEKGSIPADKLRISGVGDWMTGGAISVNAEGQQYWFKPASAIAEAEMPLTRMAQDVLLTKTPQEVTDDKGNRYYIYPDINIGANADGTVNPKASTMTVRVKRYTVDNAGNKIPVNFEGTNQSILDISSIYRNYELPSYMNRLTGK